MTRYWDFTFHLKSGQSFTVRAETLKTGVHQNGGAFVEYDIDHGDSKGERLQQIVLDQIAAITKKRVSWWRS
jgi:hypothetical protein